MKGSDSPASLNSFFCKDISYSTALSGLISTCQREKPIAPNSVYRTAKTISLPEKRWRIENGFVVRDSFSLTSHKLLKESDNRYKENYLLSKSRRSALPTLLISFSTADPKHLSFFVQNLKIIKANVSIVRTSTKPLSFTLLDQSSLSYSNAVDTSFKRHYRDGVDLNLNIDNESVVISVRWVSSSSSNASGWLAKNDPRLLPISITFLVELAFLIIIAFVLLY